MFKRKKKRVYTAKNGRKKACIQLKTTKDRYVFTNTAVFKQKKESVYTAKNYQRQMCFHLHSCV